MLLMLKCLVIVIGGKRCGCLDDNPIIIGGKHCSHHDDRGIIIVVNGLNNNLYHFVMVQNTGCPKKMYTLFESL